MLSPSGDHFGEPANLPAGVSLRTSVPSARVRYMLTACDCSNRPPSRLTGVLRSDENAIHFPSGDQDGRKLAVARVRFRAFLVCKSSTQISADPLPREETKASCFPSGESAP